MCRFRHCMTVLLGLCASRASKVSDARGAKKTGAGGTVLTTTMGQVPCFSSIGERAAHTIEYSSQTQTISSHYSAVPVVTACLLGLGALLAVTRAQKEGEKTRKPPSLSESCTKKEMPRHLGILRCLLCTQPPKNRNCTQFFRNFM